MRKSRRVLITGGSSGLGLALAESLLLRGDTVLLLARDAAKLDAASQMLRAKIPDARVATLATDISAPSVTSDLTDAIGAMGGLDLLINSAGILREGYAEDLTEQDYRQTMETNFFGTVRVIRALLPELRRSGHGHIVNVASVAALTGVFGYTAYCSSKFALLGFSEALRAELNPQGIRVQVVCPPEFDSPMVDALDQTRTPENQAHTLTIPKMSVEAVAQALVSGLERAEFLVIPGAQTRLMALGMRHFPGISRWIADRRIRSVYRGSQNSAAR